MQTPDNAVVVLQSFATELQANPVMAALNRAGIQAEMIGELTCENRCEGPGWVRILVHQGDRQRALAVIEAARESAAEIDWSTVDVGTPESAEVSESSRSPAALLLIALVVVQLIYFYLHRR